MYITFEGCLSEPSMKRITTTNLEYGDSLIDALKVRDVLFVVDQKFSTWLYQSREFLKIEVIVVADVLSEVPTSAEVLFDIVSGADFLSLTSNPADTGSKPESDERDKVGDPVGHEGDSND